MILVSACLAGIPCNYNGEAAPDEKILSLIREGVAFPVCPEVLGGLTIPRSKARIIEGMIKGEESVITDDGHDVTREFLRGAQLTLKILQTVGIDTVILKQDSPSCGNGRTLGGRYQAVRISGDGVTAALLKREKIKIFSEEDLADDKLFERLKTEHLNAKKEPVLISMCGLGVPCQYRARSFSRKGFISELKKKYTLYPLCPEQFGGMPTPRSACHLEGGQVIGKDGKDYTAPYCLGASIVLAYVKMAGIKKAYMKKGSPSCGVGGIARALLEKEGIKVCLL